MNWLLLWLWLWLLLWLGCGRGVSAVAVGVAAAAARAVAAGGKGERGGEERGGVKLGDECRVCDTLSVHGGREGRSEYKSTKSYRSTARESALTL